MQLEDFIKELANHEAYNAMVANGDGFINADILLASDTVINGQAIQTVVLK